MADDGEDDDLYGDLPLGNAATNARADELEAELSKLKGELDAERAQAAAAAAEAGRREGELRAENDILLKNISCVFKTAQAEIKRKDDAIKELRAKLAQHGLV